MSTRGLTRRHLLKGGGALLTGSIMLRPGSGLSAGQALGVPVEQEDALFGVVEQVAPPWTLNIRGREGSRVITFAQEATFWRGRSGRVAGLSAFVPGDEVVVEGRWTAGIFAATTLMSMYRMVTGRIVHRQGDWLETTSTAIKLVPDTILLSGDGFVAKPLARLGVGDDVVVDAWRDPSTGELVVRRIGVRKVS